MEPARPDVRIEDLLAQREWVQRVARALAADDHAADDLEQDLWVSVLERPATGRPRSLRAWLGSALRFKAVDRWRGENRRRRREQRVAAAVPTSPAADEVVARGELLRRVVVLVMELDEPYRSTVLLRYFEELAPAAIAVRQGVPRETVHTRLRRALARLRAQLDAEHDGKRRAWLVPMAGLLGPRGGGGGAASPATAAAGGTATATKTTAALAACVGLAVAAGLWLASDAGDRFADGTREFATGESAPSRGRAARPEVAGTPTPGSAADAATAEEPEAPGRPRGVLRGTVVLADGRTPVHDAHVRVLPYGGEVPEGMTPPRLTLRERLVRTGRDGRFLVEDVPVGAWKVNATKPGVGRAEGTGFAGAEPTWTALRLEAPSDGAATVRIRLVDEAGHPVPGAQVAAYAERDRPFASAVSDADGRASLEIVRNAAALVLATSEGLAARAIVSRDFQARGAIVRTTAADGTLAAGVASVPPDGDAVLVLRPSGRVTGTVAGPGGRAASGATVEAWGLAHERQGGVAAGFHREARIAADGAYRFDGLPPGGYLLFVRHAGGLAVPSPIVQDDQGGWSGPPYLDVPRVDVAPGREAVRDLALVEGGTIRGRVERADGSPVAGVRIELHLPLGPFDYPEQVKRAGVPLWRLDGEPIRDELRHPANWTFIRTAADGTYEMRGLPPAATWRVRAVPPPDLSFDLRDPVDVRAGAPVELVHRVEPAGTLEALTPPWGQFALCRDGETAARVALIPPRNGAVRIPGLAAGAWALVRVGPREEQTPLLRFEIAAGETTVLDARDAGLQEVTLTFVDGMLPIAGVDVGGLSFTGRLLSDAAGIVRLRGWVGDEGGKGGGGAATTVFDFRAPFADAVLLRGGTVALDRAPARDGWRTTIAVPAGRIAFRARDALGQSSPGVSIRLTRNTRGFWGVPPGLDPESETRTTARDGWAAFSTLPAATYDWTAEFADGLHRHGTVEIAADESRQVDLAGEETGTIRASILLPDGGPAAGARVSLRLLRPPLVPDVRAEDPWAAAEPVPADGQAGADGVLVVRGVPRGRVLVTAFVRGNGWPRPDAEEPSEPMELESNPPAELPVTLRLRPPRESVAKPDVSGR